MLPDRETPISICAGVQVLSKKLSEVINESLLRFLTQAVGIPFTSPKVAAIWPFARLPKGLLMRQAVGSGSGSRSGRVPVRTGALVEKGGLFTPVRLQLLVVESRLLLLNFQ